MTATDDLKTRLFDAGFPKGLLPDGVTKLTYDEASGRFEVTFDKALKEKVGGFTVLYAKQLTGTIVPGHITDLKGVQVRVAVLKPAVTEITLSPSKTKVVFTVAGAKKAFPVSEFA